MSNINIFISYCTEDIVLMEYLKNSLEKFPPLRAIVVPLEKSNLSYNAEKIKTALNNADIFLPILTSNSIKNQWVNQEIGYAIREFKIENIKPIVQKSITTELKGFLSGSNDLNYRFELNEFEKTANELINDLYLKYKNHGNYNIG